MGSLAATVATVLSLISVVLFAGPRLIDRTVVDRLIAEAMAAGFGQAVRIDGEATVQLLPRPTVTARDVRILTAGAEVAVDIPRMQVLLAWTPLIVGTARAEQIDIEGPTLFVAESAGDLAQFNRWPRLGVGRLAVRDGLVMGTKEPLAGSISMIVQATADQGPFEVQARAKVDGRDVTATATLARMDEGRPVGLAIRLVSNAVEVQVTGALRLTSARWEAAGRVRASTPEASEIARWFPLAAAMLDPKRPFRIEANVSATADALMITEVSMEAGESRLAGRGVVRWTQPLSADLAIAANRLPLEPLIALASNIDVGWLVCGGSVLNVDLAADSLAYRQGAMRQVRLGMRAANGGLTVRQLTAALPGSSELVASGTLQWPNGHLSVEGDIELTAENLRQTVDWLGFGVAGVPADRLRRAHLSTRLSTTPDEVRANAIDLRLDNSRVIGSGSLSLGAEPTVAARLAVDRANLDAYGLNAPGTVGDIVEILSGSPWPVPVNVALSADLLTWFGTALRDVGFDLRLGRGRLDVRKFRIVDLGGATLDIDGHVASEGEPEGDLRFRLQTSAPERFLRLIDADWPVGPEWQEAVSADGRLRGSLASLALSGQAVANGGRANLVGTMDLTRLGGVARSLTLMEETMVSIRRLAGRP